MDNRRQHILDTMEDMIDDFLYYNRKDDDELPLGSIQEAILKGEITVDDMVALFQEQIVEKIQWEWMTKP